MHRRPSTLLVAVVALVASGLPLLAAAPAGAAPPAPVILNNGGQNSGNAQWLETQGLPDDGGVRQVFVTFLVQHPVGRSVTGIRADLDFDGADESGSAGITGVTAQELRLGATNRLETSRVTVPFTVSKPNGFRCVSFSGPDRSVDAPVRFRVVDSTGEASAPVTGTVRFVEDSNCLGAQDFPRLTSASQNLTEVTPEQNITYTFSCDDVDAAGSSDDDCDRANIRWRRLDDGTTSPTSLKTGMNDNTSTTHSMSFPSQGYYVVEAQLGNENGSFPNAGAPTGGWVRLGNAVVNDSASSLSGSIAFPGAEPSSPPSVNAGTAMSAVASAADDGGVIQVIEWDSDNNGSFERTEFTVPTVSGGNIAHPALTTVELTQPVATATPGLRTVQARVTDNGALDAADNIRRSLTFSGQLRVNAIPTASPVSATTNEDTAATINLLGNDADNQPNPLAYDIVSAPPAGAGSLGPVSSTGAVTFTPASNSNGTTSFTYRVRDGSTSTVAAWATSSTATVTITVNAVNDAPTVTGGSITTNEDTPGSLTVTGSDVEDGPNLTFTAHAQPTNGTASCSAAGACTYTPNPDFFGTDSFIVRGTDSGGLSATATVTVTVVPVNDAPVAVDGSVTVAEDSTNNPITLAAGDVDDVSVSFVAPVDDVDHGTLSCAGQACAYTPSPDYNGPDSFTFEVSDGELTDTGTVTIDVTPVNDAPVAVDVEAETDEDVVAPLALGGTDVDGDPVTVVSTTDPAHGTATVTGPSSVDYLGDANFFGIDVFDFTVTDGQGAFDVGTATITVLPVNDAPVVEDQTMTVDEDTPAILSLAAGDVDGDALTWSIVSGPGSGQLVGDGPDVVYTGSLNFHGTDGFVVQVDDGNGGIDTAVVTVVVNPVNDQPVASASSVQTDEDEGVEITLEATDVDGDALTFAAPVLAPSNGTVICEVATCTYTPNPDFNGSDMFTFAVDDGNGGTDSASVSVEVRPVNDPPVASDLTVVTAEDAAVATPLPATDVDGDPLTYTVTAAANGTITGTGSNRVYEPNPNFAGADSFGFTASDGQGGSDSATVSITVTPVNDAPVATGGSASTDEDVPVSFQLGATDVEDDTLTFTVTEPPADGTLECAPDGSCDFTPAPGFSGVVWVSYSVSDGDLTSNGVFSISVAAVNDPPTAEDTTVTTAEDTAVTITLEADDEDGDSLTYTVLSGPTNGTLACTAAGDSCVYTPASNFAGGDAFTWAASDGDPGQATATVSITVTPVNDAPVALDVAGTTDEEVPVTLALLATDVDGDDLTYSLASTPSNGTASVSGSDVTYTPSTDFNGVDTFRFRVTDTSGGSTEATVTVTVVGLPLIDTHLVAEAAVARVRLSITGGWLSTAVAVFPGVEAKLLTATNAPVAGRTLSFSAGGTFLCSAVTDAQGVARCGATTSGIAALLHLGYQVSFAGDADHAGSTARGPIIQVLSIVL